MGRKIAIIVTIIALIAMLASVILSLAYGRGAVLRAVALSACFLVIMWLSYRADKRRGH
jgi:Ca2+/Na+ antiporter